MPPTLEKTRNKRADRKVKCQSDRKPVTPLAVLLSSEGKCPGLHSNSEGILLHTSLLITWTRQNKRSWQSSLICLRFHLRTAITKPYDFTGERWEGHTHSLSHCFLFGPSLPLDLSSVSKVSPLMKEDDSHKNNSISPPLTPGAEFEVAVQSHTWHW